jgi:ribosome maturation factor RimP
MQLTLAQLTSDIRARVADLGYEVVDVRRTGSARRSRLQVRIDRPGAEPGHGVTIDDCAAVSRHLQAWLDASGAAGEGYALEVSSPGIERPVRWPEHWARFVGREVRVRVPGRGRVQATIAAVDQEAEVVHLTVGDEALSVAISDTRDATLVVDWNATLRSPTRDAKRSRGLGAGED